MDDPQLAETSSNGLLVSVVMPVFNPGQRFHLFQEAVRSVANQTLRSWEIVVVDDASTDDSCVRIRNFLESLGCPFQLIESTPNAGPSVARNIGIERSRGQHVAFLDWDDLYFPTFLEDAVEAMRDDTVDWVLAPTVFFTQLGQEQQACGEPFHPEVNSMEFVSLCGYYLLHNFPTAMGSSLVLRRRVFDQHPELRFDPYLSKLTAEDILFGFELLKAGVRPHVVSRPGAVHRTFVEVISRRITAFMHLDEFEVDQYINRKVGDELISTVEKSAPDTASELWRRRSLRHDRLLVKRYLIQRDFGALFRLVAQRPRLAKTALRYGLNFYGAVPGIGWLLRQLEFRRTQNDESALKIVQELTAHVADPPANR